MYVPSLVSAAQRSGGTAARSCSAASVNSPATSSRAAPRTVVADVVEQDVLDAPVGGLPSAIGAGGEEGATVVTHVQVDATSLRHDRDVRSYASYYI
jgi:hypothetical protein